MHFCSIAGAYKQLSTSASSTACASRSFLLDIRSQIGVMISNFGNFFAAALAANVASIRVMQKVGLRLQMNFFLRTIRSRSCHLCSRSR